MKKVAVIGHFAFGRESLDGQTVKTKNVTDALRRAVGEDNVLCFDTHGGVRALLKSFVTVFKALRKSENVIIMPAHNGLKVFGRLLPLFRKLFKNRKIHYSVIGGWLPRVLENKKGLARALKKFDGIYVETGTMKRALEAQGFENVCVMPNFKAIEPVAECDLVYHKMPPYKLCTFSRVMKEKGIEAAINAIDEINLKNGKTVYTLDIYGPIDQNQTEWFEKIRSGFSENIKYCGCVPSEDSVGVLKNYFALLFPTEFYTEGIPGTIIDAYAAGVPVISSRWESFSDMVDDGVTGKGYEFGNAREFTEVLDGSANDPDSLNAMKRACLAKSSEFMPDCAIQILVERLS